MGVRQCRKLCIDTSKWQKTKKPENVMLTDFWLPFSGLKVVWEGIEPNLYTPVKS